MKDIKIRAKAVAEASKPGVSLESIAKKYGVSKSTVSKWVKEAQVDLAEPVETDCVEIVNERAVTRLEFQRQLIRTLLKVVVMVDAWATECTDPQFIRKNPLAVNELGKSAIAFADRLAGFAPSEEKHGDQLP